MFKKLSLPVMALFAMLCSCSQEDIILDQQNGSEILTTIQVKAPEYIGSRSVPDVYADNALAWNAESGYPSVGNVDLATNPLSYTVGIYIGKEVNGETVYSLVDKQAKTRVASDEAYFNFRLIKGQKYRIVAYADFAATEKDDLENISYKTDLNNELDDAFFVSEDFVADDHVAAVLKRPFGKLRLIAHDFNTFAAGEKFKITKVTVSYKGQPMLSTDNFNALTGDFNYDSTAEGDHQYENKAASYAMEFNSDGKASYAAVFTHYLPANFGEEDTSNTYAPVDEKLPVPQSWMYPFEVTVSYTDENGANPQTITRNYNLDIPVKRNWLTTVDVENFWTENSNIKVTVDHRFDGFINASEPLVKYVYDEDQLSDAIVAISESESYTGKIILGSDITMTHTSFFDIYNYNGAPIYVTVDLNGHTIDQRTPKVYNDKGELTQYSEAVFEVYGGNYGSYLTIEDSSKEGTGAILSTDPETCDLCQTIWGMFGGKITINAGTIKCCLDNSAIYTFDTDEGRQHHGPDCFSEVTVNGGWIENINGDTYVGEYGLMYLADTLVNIYNNDNSGRIYLNGGSYVDFDPRKGDNICGNSTNYWVDSDHDVVVETINGKTVYTVISKDNPSYY